MTTVQAPRVVGPAFVDEVLQHLEALPGRCTLVLEDLHEVQSPEALATLDLMLASRPANLHVVMVTRSDPPLALHRLRLAGELTEIRTRDLAFTDDETTSMLTQHGVELTRDDHAHLMAKTEGWAAGIRLAAISLQDRPDPSEQSMLIQAFAGSQRAIADYLVTEVLDRQPDRLREFLLRTCVVERVDARLANVLAETDDAAEALDTLERRGAFVTALDDATGWYRFHRLFGEMCRHQLEVRSPALVPDLHARAARWFAETGEANEALRHAIQSRDWDLVGRVGVLVAGGQTFGHEGRGTRASLRAIPEDAAPDNAWIAFAHALGCDDSGEVVDLEQRLAVADGVLARDPEAPPVLLGLSHLLSAMALRGSGRVGEAVDRLNLAVGAFGLVPARETPALPSYVGYTRALLGNCLFWTGDLEAARRELGWAAGRGEDDDAVVRDIALMSGAYVSLVDAVLGDVRGAHERGSAALDAASRAGWPEGLLPISARVALGLAYCDRGETHTADALLARVAVALTERPDRLLSALHAWASVRLSMDGEQPEQAAGDLERVRAVCAAIPQAALLGRLLADAEREIERRPATGEDAFDTRSDRTLIEGWVRTALEEEDQRRDDAALLALGSALELAAVSGIVRPLTRSADDLQPLLQRHARVVGTHGEVVTRLVPSRIPVDPGSTVDRLTDRELSVLRLLPTMMSNAEIADELFVSVNTVKAHLKSLYRKLGAGSRREAVLLGRQPLAALAPVSAAPASPPRSPAGPSRATPPPAPPAPRPAAAPGG
jgi:LuxR family maltose regulon positive regulatory protein